VVCFNSISKIGIKAFAPKPAVKADLAKTVRNVLDAPDVKGCHAYFYIEPLKRGAKNKVNPVVNILVFFVFRRNRLGFFTLFWPQQDTC
jgi:hypothetical protein